tara:strand:+ start:2268 stop:2843 length:576 start_codon:yes stop_codon:yes gene_type:complete
MSWQQKENAIREKRTILATRNNLMGPSGKLGVIVMTLGSPIVRQSGVDMDVTFLEDPYEDSSDTEFANTASEQQGPVAWKDEIIEGTDDMVHEEGFVFDGLSRGMHIEIKYWHLNHRLEVNYRGYDVYKESGGELFAYAPFPEWEEMIGRLYKAAKPKAKERKGLREVEIGQAIERRKESFWKRLRSRWGV